MRELHEVVNAVFVALAYQGIITVLSQQQAKPLGLGRYFQDILLTFVKLITLSSALCMVTTYVLFLPTLHSNSRLSLAGKQRLA